jgi:hypothetical protein
MNENNNNEWNKGSGYVTITSSNADASGIANSARWSSVTYMPTSYFSYDGPKFNIIIKPILNKNIKIL